MQTHGSTQIYLDTCCCHLPNLTETQKMVIWSHLSMTQHCS